MSDETVTEEEVAAEEESEAPAVVALDKAGLLAKAQERVAAITARGKDPNVTYAGYVVNLLAPPEPAPPEPTPEEVAAADAALDAALRAEAQVRLDTVLKDSSAPYRRHALAGMVQGGKFDA